MELSYLLLELRLKICIQEGQNFLIFGYLVLGGVLLPPKISNQLDSWYVIELKIFHAWSKFRPLWTSLAFVGELKVPKNQHKHASFGPTGTFALWKSCNTEGVHLALCLLFSLLYQKKSIQLSIQTLTRDCVPIVLYFGAETEGAF